MTDQFGDRPAENPVQKILGHCPANRVALDVRRKADWPPRIDDFEQSLFGHDAHDRGDGRVGVVAIFADDIVNITNARRPLFPEHGKDFGFYGGWMLRWGTWHKFLSI